MISNNKFMRIYLFLIFIGIIFTSCKMNRTVDLFPVEPFESYENNIKFSISPKQPLWIGFQWPLAHSLPEAYFIMFITTNENIKNVLLKSISINFKELDFIFTKNEIIHLQNQTQSINSGDNYYCSIRTEIPTNEILNEYNPNISLSNFHSRFNKVDEIEYIITIEYNINEQNYETEVVWKYKSKKRTSIARWDALMGI